MSPLVTAVIPVYNGERFIADAVHSVLTQTEADVEVVVVDDGSTDGTAEVVRAISDGRVRYTHQANAGVSGARNRGIDEATGDHVAFLDADDVWLPDKVAAEIHALRQRPRAGLVVSGYMIVDEALVPKRPVIPRSATVDLVRVLLLEESGIGLSFTGMVRRHIAAEIRFDTSYSTSADLEFALRVGREHEVVAVRDRLALYRTHIDQMHLDLVAFEEEVLRLYDMWLGSDTPLASRRARGVGNLYTRLMFYELLRRNPAGARRALARAIRSRPDRLVLLPLTVLAVRTRGRLAARQAPTPRADAR
jgi:glycosyltransferase involved in cell wall biosynthesis